MTPVRGKVTENVSGVRKTSSNHHSRGQRLRDGKMLKSSAFILMKPQLQTDQGKARGEHFQHLTRKWVHSVLGTNLCQHPVFLCLSHIEYPVPRIPKGQTVKAGNTPHECLPVTGEGTAVISMCSLQQRLPSILMGKKNLRKDCRPIFPGFSRTGMDV